MININEYEETFTQLGITKDEANEVIRFFEVLAQIAIENNITKVSQVNIHSSCD